MLNILRQLTPDELRQVTLATGAHPGAQPQEIVRYLCRLCGVTRGMIFPATTEDVLLDEMGRRLGMPPLAGGVGALAARERAILGFYLRQAWLAADLHDRRRLLERAAAHWDNPAQPCPELPPADADDAVQLLTLESMLQTPAGCRALAMAEAEVPLTLPPGLFGSVPRMFRLLWSGSAVEGHRALFQVLLVLRRARARLVRERRAQRERLRRQLEQREALAAVTRRELGAAPDAWDTSPLGGLAMVAGAAASVAVHGWVAEITPFVVAAAALAAAGGVLWSAVAAGRRSRSPAERWLARIAPSAHDLRGQLALVGRELAQLERE